MNYQYECKQLHDSALAVMDCLADAGACCLRWILEQGV